MDRKNLDELENNTRIKIAALIKEEILDGNYKEAEQKVSGYIKTKIREESLADQLYRVRTDINLTSPEVIQMPDLEETANTLFKGLLEEKIKGFVRIKLASYAQAFEGTFSRSAHANMPRREYAYFPIIRLWTNELVFEKDKLEIWSDSELIQDIDNDFVYAFAQRKDAIVKRLMENALVKVPANKIISTNTTIQRSDLKALLDQMYDQELKADVLFGSAKRFNDILLYDGTDIGDHAGNTLKEGADYYDMLAGLRRKSSITSPIVADGGLWVMAAADYVGEIFDITPITVKIKDDDYDGFYRVKAYMDVAIGLANLKGVAKLEFA